MLCYVLVKINKRSQQQIFWLVSRQIRWLATAPTVHIGWVNFLHFIIVSPSLTFVKTRLNSVKTSYSQWQRRRDNWKMKRIYSAGGQPAAASLVIFGPGWYQWRGSGNPPDIRRRSLENRLQISVIRRIYIPIWISLLLICLMEIKSSLIFLFWINSAWPTEKHINFPPILNHPIT